MADAVAGLSPQDRPVINPLYLFRWEEAQESYVLLYPEGIVKLNETAGEILSRCDGERTVAQLTDELRELYLDAGGEVDAGIRRFLELAYAKGWIRRGA